ncbi:two-component system LytT family sensor kinase [Lipingzhangella halophila]|uniref:histidine kinase n=1 Tax=Lipingzhangella halophila TaxID=1783352 RepID=A0A7W7W3A8_9ACTN|nr:histidine kinase [Lipingzhangella halophila]MBB4932581.1 two-component system LytT family sensor kinase [Lipingzhangella halophila]
MARTDRRSVLSEFRKLNDDLRDGLRGRGAGSAARRLGKLLDADAVVLADLDGAVTQYGALPPETDLEALLAQVYGRGGVSRQPPLSAAPLFVADDLAGCLVVSGDIAQGELSEVAGLVSDHLDHADLRMSRERVAAADLRSLRAQISPHFMHNALAAIAALIHSEPDRARELLSDFADYLRYSFSSAGDYATVATELQATQTYLELQRARFRDRFDVTVRIAPEVLPVAIPFLVVQPIVENAVRHGLEQKPGGEGRISVSGFGEGPLCVIEIEDDGVGMDPELARSVLAGTGPPAKGVGLANVDQRLRKVYGPEYGLVIETAPASGTKVMIRIPRFMRGVVAE